MVTTISHLNLFQAVQEAGGFLVGADDVVQPYHLPRDLHEKPKTPPPHSSATTDVAQGQELESTRPVTLRLDTLDDSEDERDMIEEPIPVQVASAVPMTMRQLAEAAERQRSESCVSSPSRIQTPDPQPISISTTELDGALQGRRTRSNTGTLASRPTRNTANDTSLNKAGNSRRGRKRARRTSDAIGSSGADAEVGAVPATSTHAKRARPNPAPVVKSDRVLRARKGKSEEQLRQEKEAEVAYERAVAE